MKTNIERSLLTSVKRRKVEWYGHVTRLSGLTGQDCPTANSTRMEITSESGLTLNGYHTVERREPPRVEEVCCKISRQSQPVFTHLGDSLGQHYLKLATLFTMMMMDSVTTVVSAGQRPISLLFQLQSQFHLKHGSIVDRNSPYKTTSRLSAVSLCH